MKTLSPYTIAKNCTDLSDIQTGIDEIIQFIRSNPKNTKLAYKRLNSLIKKQSKITKN